MRFDVLTLFPGMFAGPLNESILKRAQQAGLINVHLHNIRDWAVDRHHTADDAPYGGGAGMVMKAAPMAAAIRAVLDQDRNPEPPPVILLSPAGELFEHAIAQELAAAPRLLLVCAHYEGLDERVREQLITRELSIGDYVLTGGELAAMVLIDAVARLRPGVIDAESIGEESHRDHLLEYPHYTRPALWEGHPVPPVLLSGHHGEVARWRRQERLRRTFARRPDLLPKAYATGQLSRDDLRLLAEWGWRPD